MNRKNEDTLSTQSVEDFVKAIYKLQQDSERVSTNALAEERGISAPSVTDMAQRLVDAGLVDYRKYYGVRLTEAGETMALKVIRRHRLLELYLVRELGYLLHEVHIEAENLEHAVSDRFVEAIARKLGHPEFDPHGDPIPAVDGTMTQRTLQTLAELDLHLPARVSRFGDMTPEMLQYILERGFKLNLPIRVIARDPFEGPITILLDNVERVIGHTIANAILVELNS